MKVTKEAALAEIKQLAAQRGHNLSDDEAESILSEYLAAIEKDVIDGTSKVKPVGILATGKLKAENIIKLNDALSKVYENYVRAYWLYQSPIGREYIKFVAEEERKELIKKLKEKGEE